MKDSPKTPFFQWMLRECFRYPRIAWSTVACLFILTLFPGVILCLTQALGTTAEQLLARSPAMVIRKIGPLGWQPIPTEYVDALGQIPGVNRVEPRIWGLAHAEYNTFTLIGFGPSAQTLKEAQIAIGAGNSTEQLDSLEFKTVPDESFKVVPTPEGLHMWPGTALVNEFDARRILQLPLGYVSDIALYFFHPQEAAYVDEEIRALFPFDVQLETSQDYAKRYNSSLFKWGGLGLLLGMPMLLAAFFFFIGQRHYLNLESRNIGIMKLMGWRVKDLLWLQAGRALLLGIPSVSLGIATSYFMVYGPGSRILIRIFMGWSEPTPDFRFALGLTTIFQLVFLIFIPYLIAYLLPMYRAASRDPGEILEKQN